MGSLTHKLFTQQNNGKVIINKGNYGLSYQAIYNKVGQILGYNHITGTVDMKAARLLYVSYGIEVNDMKFGIIGIGGIDGYIVDQSMGDKYDHYPYDIAILDNRPIFFIFKDCMTNQELPKSIRLSNIYTLFDSLVAIMNESSLMTSPYSINSTIASYAPYVLTVKTLLSLGIEFELDDIYHVASDNDKVFINEETLDIVKRVSIDDLLIYGALCEYIN